MSDILSGIEIQVLRANRWHIRKPRKNGNVVCVQDVFAFRAGATVSLTVVAVPGGEWSLTIARKDGQGQPFGKSGDPADIASDAIAYAHHLSR